MKARIGIPAYIFGAAAIALAVAGGAILVRIFVLPHAPGRLQPDFAQPLVVVTAWSKYGALLYAVLALVFIALALVLRLGFVPRFDATHGPSLRATLGLAALALACFALWPVIFSSDVYAYAAYGNAVLHGGNPYAMASPAAHDAFSTAARFQWSGPFPACVYGPAFVAFATFVTALGDDRLGPTLWLFRLASGLAFLASIVAFDAVLAGNARRRAAVALFGLNPVALWSASEGHNDTLLLACALGAFALLARGRCVAAGSALGATILLKASGPLAGPFAAVLLFGRRRPGARRFALAFGIALAAGSAIALPFQLQALRAVGAHGRYAPQFSFQALAGIVPALLIAAACVAYGVRLLSGGRAAGNLWVVAGAWLGIPNPLPWYALWVLPLAAASGEPAGEALWFATISGSLRYLPEAFGKMGYVPAMLVTAVQLAPVGAAVAILVLRRRAGVAG